MSPKINFQFTLKITVVLMLFFSELLYGQNNTSSELFELKINCGGEKLSFGQDVFEADSYFTGNGKSFANSNISDIKDSERDELYLSERSTATNLGSFGYDIPVSNGKYVINLHFAEIWFGATSGGAYGTGKRVFDALLEGNQILDSYDINAEVGAMTAVIKTYEVNVTDGLLNLEFSATVNQPKLSALEIIGDPLEPRPTKIVKRINSGGGELIFDEAVFEADNFFSGDLKSFTNNNISNVLNTTLDDLY
ncbi:MAG: malectin domain-containing carbohydrate-binding protein, partial [Maribacter sp.]